MDKKIYVAGMSCEHCEKKVNDAVSSIAGVTSCTANAVKAQVLVSYDDATAGIEDAVNAAILGCGYEILG